MTTSAEPRAADGRVGAEPAPGELRARLFLHCMLPLADVALRHAPGLLRIGELSRRHGVSPDLLRVWERRYGLLNIQTGGSADANTPATNFSVVRVNRDFLRRSRIGGIFTRRDPVAATKYKASGQDNLAYGVDTLISPTNDISILGYAAKTAPFRPSSRGTPQIGN